MPPGIFGNPQSTCRYFILSTHHHQQTRQRLRTFATDQNPKHYFDHNEDVFYATRKGSFIATKEIGAQSFCFVHSSVHVTAINFAVFPLIFQVEPKEERAIYELFLFHSPTNK